MFHCSRLPVGDLGIVAATQDKRTPLYDSWDYPLVGYYGLAGKAVAVSVFISLLELK